MTKIEKTIKQLIDISNHKLVYILGMKDYIHGIWNTLHHYGIPYTKENHELLVEMVQEKLEGPDLEREWTEDEYNNFVLYKEETK